MRKTSFWNTLGNTVETVLIIKYVIPFLVVLFAILFGIAIINKEHVSSKVDKEHSILYTDLRKSIYTIASNSLNNSEFELELEDLEISGMCEVELDYYIKNKEYSAEQYDNLLKQEITKVYNQIKEKSLVNDTLFGKDDILEKVDIYFNLLYDKNKLNQWIGGGGLKYSFENRWDSSYQKVMESTITTQEKLNEVKNK